jgi:Right handed beta helix region
MSDRSLVWRAVRVVPPLAVAAASLAYLALGPTPDLVVDSAAARPVQVAKKPPKTKKAVVCDDLQEAIWNARPGSTVLLAGGTCARELIIDHRSITLKAAPGAKPVLVGAGRVGGSAILVKESDGTTIGPGLEIVNPNGNGMQIVSSSRIRIVGNKIHDNAAQGILVAASGGARNRDIDIVRNELWSNGKSSPVIFQSDPSFYAFGMHSIYYGGGSGGVTEGGRIALNYIHDQHTGYGIQVGGLARGVVVVNNTIARVTASAGGPQGGRAGDCIQVYSEGDGSRDVKVVNNVCSVAADRAVYGSGRGDQGHVWRNLAWKVAQSPAFEPRYGSVMLFNTRDNIEGTVDPRLGADGRPRKGSPLKGKADPAYLPRKDFDGKRHNALGAFAVPSR